MLRWGGLLGVMLAALVVWFVRSAQRGPRLDAPRRLQQDPGEVVATSALSTPEFVEEAPSLAHDPEAWLADYWGDRWPEVRALMEADGTLAHARTGPVPDWKDVSAEILELVSCGEKSRQGLRLNERGWPDVVTEQWLQDAFSTSRSFSDARIQEVESAALEFNAEIDIKVEEYLSWIDIAIEQNWRQDHIARGPLSLSGVQRPYQKRTFYSASVLHRGWAVELALEEGAFPPIDELRKTLKELRRKRNGRLEQVLFREER